MLKYLDQLPPLRIVGMAVLFFAMLGFMIWVTGFRKKVHDILKGSKYILMVSAIVIIFCLGVLVFNKGVNYGLDFTGGTVVSLAVDPSITTSDINKAISEYKPEGGTADLFKDAKVQMGVSVENNAGFKSGGASSTLDAKDPAVPDISPSPAEEKTPDGEASPEVKKEGDKQVKEETKKVDEKTDKKTEKAEKSAKASDNKDKKAVKAEDKNAAEKVSEKDSKTEETAVSDKAVGEETPETAEGAAAVETKKENEKTAVSKPGKVVKLEKFRRCRIQVKQLNAQQVDAFVSFLQTRVGNMEFLQTETIGPTIGGELKYKAVLALLIALFAQLIYITFRFGSQLRYGVAADVALLHDLIVMVGLYTFFGKPVDLSFVAALLTIIGYSVMDTIVVFDRVRENLKIMKGKTYSEVVNLSLNQVVTRSAATSFTTILTVFAIFYFGGETLHNFALALLIGLITGTYSSLFVASPAVVWFDNMMKGQEQKRVEARRARLEEEAREKAEKKAKK